MHYFKKDFKKILLHQNFFHLLILLALFYNLLTLELYFLKSFFNKFILEN